MKRYLIEPKHQIFVKGYGFLSFANNANKKRLDYNKQSARDELKIEKGATQKTAKATGSLIGNKIVDKL